LGGLCFPYAGHARGGIVSPRFHIIPIFIEGADFGIVVRFSAAARTSDKDYGCQKEKKDLAETKVHLMRELKGKRSKNNSLLRILNGNMFLVDNLYHKVPFHFVTADVRLKGFPIGKIQNFNICCFALPAGTVLVYRSLVDSRRRSVILGSPSHGQEIDGESGDF
jgi:hypothetical protein|tara:strand:- start:7825 stop:8319 length:495 start_codon:yes stop_codon:yes gene_type:complete